MVAKKDFYLHIGGFTLCFHPSIAARIGSSFLAITISGYVVKGANHSTGIADLWIAGANGRGFILMRSLRCHIFESSGLQKSGDLSLPTWTTST